MLVPSRRARASPLLSAFCVAAPEMNMATLPPLWQMLVATLPLAFEYTPLSLAQMFKVDPRDVHKHCRELWPGRAGQGQWSLEFDQAAIVIYRMARRSRKLNPRALLEELKRAGLDGSGIQSHPNVARAWKAIESDRRERANSRGSSNRIGAVS